MSEKAKKKRAPLDFILKPLDHSCQKGIHWIVLKEVPITALSKSGLTLPSESLTNSDAFEVVAVADACGSGLKAGDIVYATQTVGYPFTSESVQYRIVSERDVLAYYDSDRVQIKLTDEDKKIIKEATKKH